MGIFETRLRAVAWVDRPRRDRDLLRDFESPAESFRGLAEELRPEGVGGELIEGEVAAHSREYGGVLAEAGVFEQLFGEAPAHLIARARINLAQPTLVFPGTAADEDAAGGKIAQAAAQMVAIEVDGIVIEGEECVQGPGAETSLGPAGRSARATTKALPGAHAPVTPGVRTRFQHASRCHPHHPRRRPALPARARPDLVPAIRQVLNYRLRSAVVELQIARIFMA